AHGVHEDSGRDRRSGVGQNLPGRPLEDRPLLDEQEDHHDLLTPTRFPRKERLMRNESGRTRRVVLSVFVALAATLGGSVAANAINSPGVWNTQASPLYLTSYGSKAWA